MHQTALTTSHLVDSTSPVGLRDAGEVTTFAPASIKAGGLEIEIVTTRARFDALGPEWTTLYDRVGQPGQPFQSFAWSWHWANNFLPSDKAMGEKVSLFIVTGRRAGRLVLVFPLVRTRSKGLVELRALGDPVGEYSDALVSTEVDVLGALRLAWAHVTQHAQADFVVLTNVREDAVIAPLMAEIGAVATRVDGAPYMDFSQAKSFEDYMGRFSSRSHKSRRRRRQKLMEIGPLRLAVTTGGVEAQKAAERTVALKRKWSRDRGIVSRSLADPRVANFLRDAADGCGHDTGCQIVELYCGDSVIATELTIQAKGRVFSHVLAYDVDFVKHSPGNLLTEDSIGLCFGNGIATYDFMGPSDSYKLKWSDRVKVVTDYAVPLSLKGRLWVHAYLGYGRERLKKLVASLPTSIRRTLASAYALLVPVVV